MRTNRRWFGCGLHLHGAVIGLIVLMTSSAWGHPLSQGALKVVIYPGHVTVRARVMMEEFLVTDMAVPSVSAPASASTGPLAPYEQHARYLAKHIHVLADGTPLCGQVVHVSAPAGGGATSNQYLVYDLDYRPTGSMASPRRINLQQDVLTDGQFTTGVNWEATYVVGICQIDRQAQEGWLLTRNQPINLPCNWSAAGAADAAPAVINRGRLFGEYFWHGVHHILTGYDHLLFVSALVLGATTLWDLLKVVSAFTLAHTITLTLAALNLVHVSENIVEPLISASIVFVAVQNVFWPRNSHGWARLGAAFFFGLFHGLGFAGGLLEAMEHMHGPTVLLAIAAFSIGVEAGHQMVVVPLFTALRLARRAHPEEIGRERISRLAQRLGSAGISIAGVFYLFIALKPTLGLGGP